jgi:hypothetical protein
MTVGDPMLIVVPVLRRPHRVAPLIESIDAATPGPHRTLFVCSPDDHAEHAAVDAAGGERLTVDWPPGRGDYARKINAAYRQSTEPLLFFGADDLHFHPDWLPAAVAQLTEGVGVVGTNDLGNVRVISGDHATHFLVTRGYCDRGTIDEPDGPLHEGYHHNFVDDEFLATARLRNAVAMATDSHVEHLHPHWKKSEMDDTYRKGLNRFDADRRHYNSRRHHWGQTAAR